jgi:hypothetical protein
VYIPFLKNSEKNLENVQVNNSNSIIFIKQLIFVYVVHSFKYI